MSDSDSVAATISPPGPTPINEESRRLQNFLGGEIVTLADGGDWYFPKPILEFCPKFSGSKIVATVATSLGSVFDEATVAFDRSCEAASTSDTSYDGPTSLDAMMSFAVIMLRINYTLSDDELSVLLRWRPNDETSNEMWTSIQDVARGVGPKPKAGG